MEDRNSSPLKRWTQNELVRGGRDLYEVLREIERRAAHPTVGPEEAPAIVDTVRQLVRIVDGGSVSGNPLTPRPYAWVIINPSDNGGYRDHPLGVGGALDYHPAYELHGNPNVPIDGTAVVELCRAFGNFHYFSWADRPRFARLTGSSGASYAFTEIYPDAAGTFADLPAGQTGTTTQNPLIEINGVTAIASGTRVRFWQGYSSGAPQVICTRKQAGASPATREQHYVAIDRAVAGTFTLTFEGQTTSALAWNIGAAALETAIEALSNVTAAGVTGTGTTADPFIIEYQDDFATHNVIESNIAALLGDRQWLFAHCCQGTKVFTTDPTVNDDVNDGYVVGTVWVNTANDTVWVLTDSTAGAALWKQTGGPQAKYEYAEQGSDPSTPPSGQAFVYAKTDGILYFINDAGTIYNLLGGIGVGTGGQRLLQSQTFTNVANIDITGLTGYTHYKIYLYDVQAKNAGGAELRMRTSTDGGSTFDAGASDYNGATAYVVLGSSPVGDDGSTNNNFASELTLYNLAGTSLYKIWLQDSLQINSGVPAATSTCDSRSATADIDALRFYMSVGNISGKVMVYGLG